MRHLIAIIVENKPGVLTRVAALFARRGYNIESLAVGETEDNTISRITLAVSGDESVLEQITKQLNKLIDVIKVLDLTSAPHVEREMVLMRVNVTTQTRPEIMQLVNIFRARVVDLDAKNIIIEVTGNEGKVQALEDLLRRFGLKEVVRTGKIALARGDKKTK